MSDKFNNPVKHESVAGGRHAQYKDAKSRAPRSDSASIISFIYTGYFAEKTSQKSLFLVRRQLYLYMF